MTDDRGATPAELQYQKPALNDHSPASRHDIAVIALRMLGLFLLIRITTSLTYLQEWFMSSGSLGELWMFWAYGIEALIGVGLLIWAPIWARWILPLQAVAAQQRPPGTSDLQAAAFAVVGVLLIASAMPELAWALHVRGEEFTGITPGVLRPLVQIVVGAVLFLQARGLAKVWQRVRNGPGERMDE